MSLDYDELDFGATVDARKLDTMTADESLSSVFDIEEVLLYLRDVEGRVEFLKELKRARTQKIDESIGRCEEQVGKLKAIILNTMKTYEPNKKTIPFPGVGKVARRKTPAKWVIDDEQKFIEWLSEADRQVAVKVKESVVKKEADKVLERTKAASKPLPETVHYEEGGESLSISFEEPSVEEVQAKLGVKVATVEPVEVETCEHGRGQGCSVCPPKESLLL